MAVGHFGKSYYVHQKKETLRVLDCGPWPLAFLSALWDVSEIGLPGGQLLLPAVNPYKPRIYSVAAWTWFTRSLVPINCARMVPV